MEFKQINQTLTELIDKVAEGVFNKSLSKIQAEMLALQVEELSCHLKGFLAIQHLNGQYFECFSTYLKEAKE